MAFIVKKHRHAVLRVTDRQEASRFYEKLGWKEVSHLPEAMLSEMVNDAGVRIKLIFEADGKTGKRAAPLSESVKNPGRPQAVFVVDDICSLTDTLYADSAGILQEPKIFDSKYLSAVIQDPDGNVLELQEFLDATPTKGCPTRKEATTRVYPKRRFALNGETYLRRSLRRRSQTGSYYFLQWSAK